MTRAIIVDDELHCINRLKTLFAEHCKHTIQVVGEFASVQEALAGINHLKPELVFLDVQLQGQTGFDLLNQLPQIDFEVIFTTAFDNYAIKAFKFSALDYLLKPIAAADLLQALGKLQKVVNQQQLTEKFSALLYNLENPSVKTKKISLPTNKGLLFLNISDIIRCQADVNYTTIYLKDKQQLTVAKTLKDFDEMLAGHHFFRIHNSHLINMDHIKSYHNGKGGYIIMNDNTTLEVSTRRKELFLKKMQQL